MGPRRLTDTEVRTIFQCLFNNELPPPHLNFKIVQVGPEGNDLSPPNYQFEDGLYVLLRPQPKPKKGKTQRVIRDPPRAPAHLEHLMMNGVPESGVSWQLSGPQFPPTTAIQQRYCYPRGLPEYCSKKGGALWTMFDDKRKEIKEFRLLHVYFSSKRATGQKPRTTKRAAVPASAKSAPRVRARATIRKPRRSAKTAAAMAKRMRGPFQRPYMRSRAGRMPSASAAAYIQRLPAAHPIRSESPVGMGESMEASAEFGNYPAIISPENNNNSSSNVAHHEVAALDDNMDLMIGASFGNEANMQQLNDIDFPLLELTVENATSYDATEKLLNGLELPWDDSLLQESGTESRVADLKPPSAKVIQRYLDSMEAQLKELVVRSAWKDIPHHASLVASWARKVADDPLSSSLPIQVSSASEGDETPNACSSSSLGGAEAV